MHKIIKNIPRLIAITLVSLISFIPFYYTVVMATHSTDEVMLGLSLLPGKYLFQNIATALNKTFWISFRNSLRFSLLSITASVSISLMA